MAHFHYVLFGTIVFATFAGTYFCTELPRIRSERPPFELLHHPHLVERYRREAHVGGKPAPSEIAAQRVGVEEQPDDDPTSR